VNYTDVPQQWESVVGVMNFQLLQQQECWQFRKSWAPHLMVIYYT